MLSTEDVGNFTLDFYARLAPLRECRRRCFDVWSDAAKATV